MLYIVSLITAPDDYTETTVQLSFDALINRSCTSVPVVDDPDFEGPKNFTVVINSPNPNVITTPNTSTIVITDDDGWFFSFVFYTTCYWLVLSVDWWILYLYSPAC